MFLDRDGVLNGAVLYGPSPAALSVEILPGVPEACRDLAGAGLLLIGATNQPDVSRGTRSRDEVLRVNQLLLARLPLLEIRTCFHDDHDGCPCRKPKPGLLLEAAREHGIDLGRSFMVGDRWSDVAAGAAAGCSTLLVSTPYSGRDRCAPDHEVADLREAAQRILAAVRRAG